MNKQLSQDELRFKVVCSWCGVVIRRASVKDSHGMCLKCYARMLREHSRPPVPGQAPRWASDR